MIITLSRQLGSGGDIIAARVAAALGLILADRAYVFSAALAAGVPEPMLQKLMYEGRRSLASEILDSLVSRSGELASAATRVPNPLLDIFAPMLPPVAVSQEEAAQSVGLVIKDIASRGNVLILGQGAQVLLRGYAGVCHVQVVAPQDQRVTQVVEREGVSPAVARRMVRGSDQGRSDYLARYYNARWLDPLLYHLVINTGLTSVQVAVSLVVHAAQAMGSGA